MKLTMNFKKYVFDENKKENVSRLEMASDKSWQRKYGYPMYESEMEKKLSVKYVVFCFFNYKIKRVI